MMGMSGYDTQDHKLGNVTDVLKTGSNDVYVVTDEQGKEWLYAAIPDVVKSIDEKADRMVIDPPEWVDDK